MTNETLSNLIDRANGGEGPQILITRPLTDTVVWARVWLQAPWPEETTEHQYGYKVYLIRNAELRYVGIVLDHGEKDLHYFVSPEDRGQHYLSNALREVILPHLLNDRQRQRITISRNYGQQAFQASERVALAVGFVPVDVGEYEEENTATMQFTPQDRLALPVWEGQNTDPTEDRLRQIRQHLAYHASSLEMLKEEVQMHLADEGLSDEISELASQVHGLGIRIEDATWEMRRQATD